MKDKTLNVASTAEARSKIPDMEVNGDPDIWILVCKSSSKAERWMKSTKALNTPTGCFLQTSTLQEHPGGFYSLAEALTFAPGVNYVDGEFRRV